MDGERRREGGTADLERELLDVREQFAATSEILRALGRAGVEPDAILDSIVERAARLCGADAAQVYLLEDGTFSISRVYGAQMEEYARYWREHPSTLGIGRASMVGRVALDRRAHQIEDVLTDPEYGRQDLQQLAGFRSMLSSPMIVDDEVVGVLGVWRTRVAPFDDRAVELLGVFAAQAAIVIENVGLVRALESRSAELATKVDQLEALREVGDAITESLDPDEVLARIVDGAVRIAVADGGLIGEYDEVKGSFDVRIVTGGSPGLIDRMEAALGRGESNVLGRFGAAFEARELLEVADLADEADDPMVAVLVADGWHSVVGVPLHREGVLLGHLMVHRRTPGGFPPDVHDALVTLAAQSTAALVNARLFRELRTKSAELEVASRHKSEFLASMSHELRTPLNAVIGFSEVLLDRLFGEINERQEDYLRDIWASGRHLLELLNEILDLSKVEAGHMVLEPTLFAVRSALDYVLSLVRERAARHAITLVLEVADDVGVVWADELRFKQVVLNLVSNAVKFTPDGGRVELRAHREDVDVVVRVTDTGIGVPEEDRERIFDSFQQGGRSGPQEEGTGLGLTLSRRIVDLFGGDLWLEPQQGTGSTFGFRVPLPAVETTSDSDAGLPSVLLVDDDRASLDLMAAYLTGSATRVLRAHDGVEALAIARATLPSAIVLDIRLPRMDGWEVLSRAKADPTIAHIPVVVVSIVDERQRGLRMGAAAYLIKPVSRDDLLLALRGQGVTAGSPP